MEKIKIKKETLDKIITDYYKEQKGENVDISYSIYSTSFYENSSSYSMSAIIKTTKNIKGLEIETEETLSVQDIKVIIDSFLVSLGYSILDIDINREYYQGTYMDDRAYYLNNLESVSLTVEKIRSDSPRVRKSK